MTAAKALRLKAAPPLLNVLLKRFDYDLQTWQRIKLNHTWITVIGISVIYYD